MSQNITKGDIFSLHIFSLLKKKNILFTVLIQVSLFCKTKMARFIQTWHKPNKSLSLSFHKQFLVWSK